MRQEHPAGIGALRAEADVVGNVLVCFTAASASPVHATTILSSGLYDRDWGKLGLLSQAWKTADVLRGRGASETPGGARRYSAASTHEKMLLEYNPPSVGADTYMFVRVVNSPIDRSTTTTAMVRPTHKYETIDRIRNQEGRFLCSGSSAWLPRTPRRFWGDRGHRGSSGDGRRTNGVVERQHRFAEGQSDRSGPGSAGSAVQRDGRPAPRE